MSWLFFVMPEFYHTAAQQVNQFRQLGSRKGGNTDRSGLDPAENGCSGANGSTPDGVQVIRKILIGAAQADLDTVRWSLHRRFGRLYHTMSIVRYTGLKAPGSSSESPAPS